MLVQNIYYSKGSMKSRENPSQTISWDKVVVEGVDDSFTDFETSVFGLKNCQVKVNRNDFERLYNGDIKALQNKNVQFYYNASKRLVQIAVLQDKKV